MDKRTVRKSKPRSAGPYDRQNQSIFGKVCSKVKGLLNPSWLFNYSQWTSNSEEEQPGCSADVEDTVREDNDVVSHSVSHGNKRLRLRFEDHIPSIQSSGTQTWPDQPPNQNLFETVARASARASSTPQRSLLENKEPLAVLNGDDHSENSEGSASTSGCSSLVSSHKDSNRLVQSPFENIRSEMKSSRNRREAGTSNSGLSDLNNSRSLWSSSFSPAGNFQRRHPTISSTNQPNFNLSTFVGPSKLDQSMEKKVSSPFYEGRTTFGGASALRRMPPSVTPYQVDKTLRNQIRVREQPSEDNLEGMSSAAKRILLTLEKMSTPVADAKKMPNTNKSPVDLSLYLTPPKCRRNSQFTPSVSSKGPPIANISTIAKLATLKNYGVNRLRNTVSSSPVLSVEQNNSRLDYLQPSTSEANALKSGGGKMKNKMNQQHHTTKDTESEMLEVPSLPNIPLPISKLPTINFGPKPEKKVDNFLSKGFTFSNPIEPDISSVISPTSSFTLPSSYNSKIEKKSDLQHQPFTFSSPIEHELPASSTATKEKSSLTNTVASPSVKASSTWECSSCWVRNPAMKTVCIACDTPQDPKKDNSGSNFKDIAEKLQSSPAVSTSSASTTGFSFGISKTSSDRSQSSSTAFGSGPPPGFPFGTQSSSDKSRNNSGILTSTLPIGVPFGAVKTDTQNVPSKPLTSTSGISSSTPTWECSACWVRNPDKESKCLACETAKSKQESSNIKNLSATWECSTCWIKNPAKESKCMACEAVRPNKEIEVVKPNKEISSGPVISAVTSTASTWECSGCWVKNPAKESKCLACETPRSTQETSSGLASTVSNIATIWECSSCLVRNPMKEHKCLACKPLRPKSSSGLASTVSNTATTWKCSSCWVRNPMKEQKCLACETLHPNKDGSSGFKDTSGFKFSSAAESSPITFKFGSFVCTVQSTGTTSTFKFGTATSTSEMTTTTSSFKFGVPLSTTASSLFSTAASTVNKTSEIAAVPTVSTSNTGFKIPIIEIDSSEVENIQPDHNIGTSVSEKSVPNSNLISVPEVEIIESIPPTMKSSSGVNTSLVSKSSVSTASDTVITSNTLETTVSKEKDVAPPSVTACFSFSTQPLIDSKKPVGFAFGPVKEKLGSNTVVSSFSGFPISSSSKRKSCEDENSVHSESKSKVPTTENKLSTVFQLTSQPQSSFSMPSTAAPVFKFGDKTDSSKISSSTTTVALTSTTASTFNFNGNNTNFGSVTNSKASEIPTTTSASLQTALKTDDAKVPTSVSFTPSSTTTSFAFGSSTVTTSASSAFSFFPSSSASVTPTSSVFTFGASSSAAQSKPGGFTFKGVEKPQNTPTLSSTHNQLLKELSQPPSQGLNVGASATAPSGGFVFGASKTETQSTASTPFAFGAPKAEAQSATSTPFAFGSNATPTSNTSAFSAFQPTPSANQPFQFGSQPSASTASTFGSSNNFAFGSKSEAPNQITCTVSQASVPAFGSSNFTFGSKSDAPNQISSQSVSQAPAPAFGSNSSFSFNKKSEIPSSVGQNPTPAFGSSAMPSVFGSASVPSWNASAPSVGGSEKAATGGFNFGVPASGVFQFGASNPEKKPATASAAFTFGTPTAPEANNSFTTGFTMNTPPSFNFGATSTPTAGPFQFVASTNDPASGQSSAPRKIRKALRRVPRKD